MLVTQEKRLRNFWYPVMPMALLKEGPQPFVLLGESIVIWLDDAGSPCATVDRCCHRSAKLSKGWVEKGALVCPYHAWAFNSAGACVCIPQLEGKAIPSLYRIDAFQARERYGYVWVCLGQPELDLPDFSHYEKNPQYRFFQCFYEQWKTASMRVIENELDMAHFAVVHKGTFGDPSTAMPLTFRVDDVDDYTVHLEANLSVRIKGQQQINTASVSEKSTRLMKVTWKMPFLIELSMHYPSGLHHVIVNYPTPVDDQTIQVVQFCFRNDVDSTVTLDEILSYERLILNEDRSVLETTDPDVPLVRSTEMHMATDKPGLLARKKLYAYLKQSEVSKALQEGADGATAFTS